VFPAPPGTKSSYLAEANHGTKWGATTDADLVRQNFSRYPNANVGCRTGEISGFWDVEYDTPEGHDIDGAASLAALEAKHGSLPPTAQFVTPTGSVHSLFKMPPDKNIICSTSKIGPGIDVKANGGIAIFPPSEKAGKGAYRWLNSHPIADPPQWLVDAAVARPAKIERDPNIAAHRDAPKFDPDRVARWIDRKLDRDWKGDPDSPWNDQGEWILLGKALKISFPGEDGLALWIRGSHEGEPDYLEKRWWNHHDFKPDMYEGALTLNNPRFLNSGHDVAWMFGDASQPANDNPHPLVGPGTPGPQAASEAAPSKPIEIKATWKSAADLHDRTFAAIKYVISKYLAEGCTLLAGRPKIGKSWLTEDWGLNVADGGETLGEQVEQGDVLLLALEDNERRLQDRFKKILGPFRKPSARLYYETEWPRVDEGGLEKIEAWIAAMPNPKLIIIDVLARIRPLQQGRAPQYDIDYQIVASLQKIASANRIAIVVVTHVRKSGSESGDAIDKISGTLGLSGAADSFMVLDRDGQGVTLYTRGRDIEEISVAIEFKPGRCRWTVLGQAGEVRKSDERRLILDALNGSGTGMTRADLVAATEMKSNNVGVLLNKMMKAGEIMRTAGGCYLTSTPDNTVTAVTAITSTQQIFAPIRPPMPPPY
jgi:bifunctional DNA primase/polymerase-like protein/AAA domain-containing protein